MPNVTFKLGLDNREKPGLQTRSEIIANLEAQGVAVQQADPFFDAVTGELTGVNIGVPEDAAAQAQAAIDANAGVAITSPPLPDQLFILDLTDMTSTVILKVPLSGEGIRVGAVDSSFARSSAPGLLGRLSGDGASNTYTDGNVNPNPATLTHVSVEFVADRAVSNLIITPGAVSLVFDAKAPLTLANISNIDIASFGPNAPFAAFETYYADVNGKLYLANTNFTPVINRTYEEAVAAGAV